MTGHSAGSGRDEGATAPDASAGRRGPRRRVATVIVVALSLVLASACGSGDKTTSSGGGNEAAPATSAPDAGGGASGQANKDLSAEMPSPDIELVDDVVVVDSKQGAMFKGFSDDGAGMLIDKAAPGIDKVRAGSVLLLSGITVVRVTAVDTTDEGVVISGAPVTLPEVIADGDLSWNDVQYDPNKMRLRVYSPEGASGGSDSTGGSDGSSGSGGGTTDATDPDSGLTEDGIVEQGGNGINEGLSGISYPGGTGGVATPVVATVHGVPHTYVAAGKTVSGKFSNFAWSITYEPTGGSGHHIKLDLDSSGDLDGTITVDADLGSLSTSGGGTVAGRQVKNFDFSVAELGGTTQVDVNLRSTKNTTSVMTKPFFKLPFSIEFPALVGGIPFTLSLTGTIQVQLSMALANASLAGQAKFSFGGDAGMRFDGGSLSVNGKRQQDAENLVNTVKGLASGPVGVVVTAELPKVGFGFGFLQTGAGVYLSNGTVVQQSILPPPPACTGFQAAYVLAAGVEAKFLGKEFDLGRKAVVDKRWDYTVPQTQQCKP